MPGRKLPSIRGSRSARTPSVAIVHWTAVRLCGRSTTFGHRSHCRRRARSRTPGGLWWAGGIALRPRVVGGAAVGGRAVRPLVPAGRRLGGGCCAPPRPGRYSASSRRCRNPLLQGIRAGRGAAPAGATRNPLHAKARQLARHGRNRTEPLHQAVSPFASSSPHRLPWSTKTPSWTARPSISAKAPWSVTKPPWAIAVSGR
jgi:hypothetical protein